MKNFKQECRGGKPLPVVFEDQIRPGSFEHALCHLLDRIELSGFEARYCNDDGGASAYHPRVLLRIVLLAYSRGITSSRVIESLCCRDVQFMAVSGDSRPQFTTIAAFVSHSAEEIAGLFSEELLVCSLQGLIGREMFAIDGVKLPGNVSKAKSGTRKETGREAAKMRRAVIKLLGKHRVKPEALWNKTRKPKKPKLFKVSDFKIAEDHSHAICPAGKRLYRNGAHCRIGGYEAVKFTGTQRDCGNCAFRAQCLRHPQRSVVRQVALFTGKLDPGADAPVDAMKRKIDSDLGKAMITRRFATVEPVFGNIRHNKRLNRFTLRGQRKVDGRWKLYCLVHNIEKLAKSGYAMHKQ